MGCAVAVTELHFQLMDRVLPESQLALNISFLCREHTSAGLGQKEKVEEGEVNKSSGPRY